MNDMTDINKMFKQIDELVTDQGYKIDEIEKYAIESRENVRAGNKELGKARK